MSGLSFDPANAKTKPFPTRGEIRFNLVYDWTGPAFFADDSADAMSVHDNYFEQQQNPVVSLKAAKPDYLFRNNHYASGLSNPFSIDDRKIDFSAWISRTGEKPNLSKIEFVDPNRDIATYAQSIGLPDATLEGFLAAARDQQRSNT